jgi:hypothetical protein
MPSPQDWPFQDPPNVAVFTLRRIAKEGRPVLHVSHDEEDGGWQFLDGAAMSVEKDAILVGLGTMIRLDPSLAELADLPLGWEAVRDAPGRPWKRAKSEG